MANLWLDLKGPVLADTAYINGNLVAKDVAISLPAITFLTADFKAMGTFTAPMVGLVEAMEASITKVGLDLGLCQMLNLRASTLEVRWVQDIKRSDGTSSPEGCKAFLRYAPKAVPGLSLSPGELVEGELPLAVSRYQLFVGGEEYWLVDQLNTILRIHGEDYTKEIRNML